MLTDCLDCRMITGNRDSDNQKLNKFSHSPNLGLFPAVAGQALRLGQNKVIIQKNKTTRTQL